MCLPHANANPRALSSVWLHIATRKSRPHSTTYGDAFHGEDGLLKDTPTAAVHIVICFDSVRTSHSLVLFFWLASFILCCWSPNVFSPLHLQDDEESGSQQQMTATLTGSTSGEEEHLQKLKGSITLCLAEMVCDGSWRARVLTQSSVYKKPLAQRCSNHSETGSSWGEYAQAEHIRRRH